jgi:hypothetical protein
VTGWSRSARPEYKVYFDTPFEQSMEHLSRQEKSIALDICSEIEKDGPVIKRGHIAHPSHGAVLVCARDGVVVLFREKVFGPLTYLAFATGRYSASDTGQAVIEIL